MELFVAEEIIASLTLQTNKYATDFIQTNALKLGAHSRFSKWPKDEIKTNKMLAFIALTYYMGIVKKNLITSYWSVDSTIATPFPRTVMSRNEFENILLFFIAVTVVKMLPKDSLDTILRKSLVLLMRN